MSDLSEGESPREVIAHALCWNLKTPGHLCEEVHARSADKILAALSDAGYTVAKLERVGWQWGELFAPHLEPWERHNGWTPLYRIRRGPEGTETHHES